MKVLASNLYITGKFFRKIPYKPNNDNIANVAEAKFGLPRVEIIAL